MSAEEDIAVVPNYVGLSLPAAKTLVAEMGATVEVRTKAFPGLAPNTVGAQTPAKGTVVPMGKGTVVVLYVTPA